MPDKENSCLIMEKKQILNEHAGGTNIDIGLMPFLKKNSNIKTILDVGCGPGENVRYCRKLGFQAFGIDGDKSTIPKDNFFEYVDYRKKSSNFTGPFDLCWCVEFAEHIEERYINNFIIDFKKCKALIFTAAPEGWGGVGHVNEQKQEYWIKTFQTKGFEFKPSVTKEIRKISTITFNDKIRNLKKQFIRNRGLFFINTAI